MRIAVAQIDPTVGAFEANVKKVQEAYERACQEQARLLLTPELALCGYPPHDLLDRPEMFDRNERALQDLMRFTRGKTCSLAVGHVARNPSQQGRAAQNMVSILQDGKEVFRQAKTLLPTYDVFDEARYFEPASEIQFWNWDGKKVAVAICEDLWAADPTLGRRLYGRDPVETYERAKPDLIVSLSASPYEWAKRERREKLHQDIVRRVGAPLVYVNQVGATDEILFDGQAFALDSSGKLLGRLPSFTPAMGVVDLSVGTWPGIWQGVAAEASPQSESEIAVAHRGLITGIRDYFAKTGFKTAVLGLSGGIDSAVVCALAAEALGPQNVLGVAMPSQYSSGHSLEDAELLARQLGVHYEVRPIKFLHTTAQRELSEGRGELAPLAQENLQSRLRGVILMTLSNHYNSLVLTTGNKSELAMGYCTLYGDMAGALAPLGDVFKTRVYELARYINQTRGSWIPERSITKPPSAELKPGQMDQDSLPPYDILDALLELYIEQGASVEELEACFEKTPGMTPLTQKKGWVRDILKRLEINEYKRRQGAPVLKITHKAFGIGRRIPIAKRWNQ